MPRVARVVVPDCPHHVTQRGNRRTSIFKDEEDWKVYITFVKKSVEKHELDIWVNRDRGAVEEPRFVPALGGPVEIFPDHRIVVEISLGWRPRLRHDVLWLPQPDQQRTKKACEDLQIHYRGGQIDLDGDVPSTSADGSAEAVLGLPLAVFAFNLPAMPPVPPARFLVPPDPLPPCPEKRPVVRDDEHRPSLAATG